MAKLQLILYVAGQTARSLGALANLRRICETRKPQPYDVEITIVDVLENPELAEREKILATPTLVKKQPPPVRRVIGDLSATDRVVLALNLAPEPGATTQGANSP